MTRDWKFVSAKEIPHNIKTYIHLRCDLRDVEACMFYVVRLPSEFQLAALTRILHQLEVDDSDIQFLQNYLDTAQAVQRNRLLKIHLQFKLGHRLYEVRKLDLARQVYEKIQCQLDEELLIPEEQIIRLRLKVVNLLLRLEENRNEQDNCDHIDNEYRELTAELEEWLSDEEEREKSIFENCFLLHSLTAWVRIVQFCIRKRCGSAHLMDLIEWVRRIETTVPSPKLNEQLLSLYSVLLHELYSYEGVEPVHEICEYLQKFRCAFDCICQEMQLVETEDLHKARKLVKGVVHFLDAVIATRITKDREFHMCREELVRMIETTLWLARHAFGSDHPKVAFLLVSLLHVTFGDEQLDYEELCLSLLNNIDEKLVEGRIQNASFLQTLFHTLINLGAYYRRNGETFEAMQHYYRASEINESYFHFVGEQVYNEIRQEILNSVKHDAKATEREEQRLQT